MKFLFRQVWKKLLQRKLFSLFFIFNLTFGLFAFIWVDILKYSTGRYLDLNRQFLLGADLSIKTYKPLEEEDIVEIEKHISSEFMRSQTTYITSMSINPSTGESKLSSMRFINETYPLYGDFLLEDIDGELYSLKENPFLKRDLLRSNQVWIEEKLSYYLNIKVGDPIEIGELTLEVAKIIKKDPSINIGFNSGRPKVYLSQKNLKETKLYDPNSRVVFFYEYRLVNPSKASESSKSINNWVEETYPHKTILSESFETYDSSVITSLNYIGDYFGLIALTTLFLSGIGAFYLFNSHIQNSFRSIAIFMSLSPKKLTGFYITLLELLTLSMISLIVLFLLFIPSFSWAKDYINALIPDGLSLELSLRTSIVVVAIGFLNPILFCLPPLYRVFKMTPNTILREQKNIETPLSKKMRRLFSFLSLLFYYFLYVWVSNSIKMGSIFFGILLISFLVIYLTSLLLFGLIYRLRRYLPFPISITFLNLIRNAPYNLSAFIALSFSIALTSFIPQAQHSIEKQLQSPKVPTPSLFLFDIKPKDISIIQNILKLEEAQLEGITPMVNGKLVKVDGRTLKEIQLSHDKKTQERLKRLLMNRSIRFTYRDKMPENQRLLKGRPFEKRAFDFSEDTLAQISLEKSMFDLLKVKIGSILEFNVEGVPLRAEIVNSREVQWNDFRPGFFFSFQSGIFEDFPQTFVAYIPPLPIEEKISLQKKILYQIKSISILDVEEVIENSLKNFDILTLISFVIVFFSILCGIIVFFSIIIEQTIRRSHEINLMKILSPSHSTVRSIIIGEFFFLLFFSSLLGIALSLGINIALFYFFFDGVWIFSPLILLGSFLFSLITSLGISFLGTRNILERKPIELLKEQL